MCIVFEEHSNKKYPLCFGTVEFSIVQRPGCSSNQFYNVYLRMIINDDRKAKEVCKKNYNDFEQFLELQ